MNHESHPAQQFSETSVFNKVVKGEHKIAGALLKTAKILELTFDQRQQVPHDCITTDQTRVVCHIEDPVEAGDKLISSNNEWLIVAAAPEELFVVPRTQAQIQEFLHVAGLSMWPVQFKDDVVLLIASHDCMHMLQHFQLSYSDAVGPIQEISIPDLAHTDCCDHDHSHEH